MLLLFPMNNFVLFCLLCIVMEKYISVILFFQCVSFVFFIKQYGLIFCGVFYLSYRVYQILSCTYSLTVGRAGAKGGHSQAMPPPSPPR